MMLVAGRGQVKCGVHTACLLHVDSGAEGSAMNRTRIVLVIGACATALGAFLSLRAGSLATNWQPLGQGAWGGTTDPVLRQTYQVAGLAVLCFGLALLAMSAWNWMTGGRDPSGRPSTKCDGLQVAALDPHFDPFRRHLCPFRERADSQAPLRPLTAGGEPHVPPTAVLADMHLVAVQPAFPASFGDAAESSFHATDGWLPTPRVVRLVATGPV
jgi:hypothetical protein